MLTQSLTQSGLEMIVYVLTKEILKKEINVEVCCYDLLGPNANKLMNQGVKVHFLPRKPGIDWLYPLKLAFLIQERKINLIHAHNATAWFYGTWASILSGVSLVYTEHDRSFPTPIRLKYLHYILGKFTDRIVAVSEIIKENLKKYEHIKNVKVIYNGIDPDLFKPASAEEKILKKKELGLNENDFVLGNVGRMDYWKNQRILIEILPALKKISPQIKLILVGGGEEEQNLKHLAIKKGIENDVIFLGQRSDVNQILKAFDIFVFPSLTEGLPLAIIEAMATGLPVVASYVGGIPELIDHGVNGLLVAPMSAAEIKDAILKLLQNPNLRQKMGEITRQKFEAHFSLSRMVKNYLKVYDQALKSDFSLFMQN